MSTASELRPVPSNVRRFRSETFRMWRCENCRSIHCADDVDLAHYYANYPIKQLKLDFHTRTGYENRIRLLKRAGVDRSHKILDYGCAGGLFVQFLRESGFASANGYDPYEPSFADDRVLKSYNCVTSFDVIEHDDDPAAFLKRMRELAIPGGTVIVGTPNAEGVSLARLQNPALHAPYHRHILSAKALLELGRRAGLEPIDLWRRSYFDTVIPTVNSRFMWRYLEKCGDIDAATESPRTGLVAISPDLWLYAIFGYFLPANDNMIVTFRRC
ncbi:MAG TPA: class I SAM-dependent methyltransferase [Planctomycetota bacterium]|nr:class I SAM-dependent methyltransferase [Planctomycetota bacterium]